MPLNRRAIKMCPHGGQASIKKTGAASGVHAINEPRLSFIRLINKMTKFFFHFPLINQLATFRAVSELDARHQLINSPLAPYYGQAVLLGTDDGR